MWGKATGQRFECRMESGDRTEETGAERASPPRTDALPGSVLRRLLIKQPAMAPFDDLPMMPPAASGPDIAIEKLAAVTLGRVAEKLLRLPVFAQQIQFSEVSAAELSERFPEWSLFAILEGRSDALGVMSLCPQFLTSIIEMQATGRVSSRAAPARRPTRTDATIAAEFVNSFLGDLGRHLPAPQQLPDFAAFRYATYLDDPRPLGLMLDDLPFWLLTLQFRAGAGGQRNCTLHLALPVTPQAQSGFVLQLPMTDDPEPIPVPPLPDGGDTLAKAVQDAPVDLVGILARRNLSLHALRGLTVGSLIPLPAKALAQIRLETPRGQLIAQGRLGEADGQYALRLRANAAPDDRPEAADIAQPFAFAPEPPMADLAMPDAFRAPADPPQPFADLLDLAAID